MRRTKAVKVVLITNEFFNGILKDHPILETDGLTLSAKAVAILHDVFIKKERYSTSAEKRGVKEPYVMQLANLFEGKLSKNFEIVKGRDYIKGCQFYILTDF